MSLGKVIKEARDRKGYSQAELGSLVGKSRQAVFGWERDSFLPSASTIAALAKVLGLEVRLMMDEMPSQEASADV